MRLRNAVLPVVALSCLLGPGRRADAALVAYVADDAAVSGGNDTVVTDQGPGDNFPGSAVAGQVNAGALNVSGFAIVTNVAQSKPLLGSAAAPSVSLTFSATSNDNLSHTVYLFLSDTGFTGAGTLQLTLGGAQPPAGGGNTVVGRAWGGNSNGNLVLTNLLAQTAGSGATPFALSAGGPLAPTANPYGLTVGVAITRTGPGTTSGELSATLVPEPSGLIAAAAGCGLLGRRRPRR